MLQKNRMVWPTRYMPVRQFFPPPSADVWVVSEHYTQPCCGRWHVRLLEHMCTRFFGVCAQERSCWITDLLDESNEFSKVGFTSNSFRVPLSLNSIYTQGSFTRRFLRLRAARGQLRSTGCGRRARSRCASIPQKGKGRREHARWSTGVRVCAATRAVVTTHRRRAGGNSALCRVEAGSLGSRSWRAGRL